MDEALAARPVQLSADRVHVAEPGVDTAVVALGTPGGGELLCVATLTPGKGHDLLLAALATLADLPWRCVCAGESLSEIPTSLVNSCGWRGTRESATAFASSGPSTVRTSISPMRTRTRWYWRRGREFYGMVVTEALRAWHPGGRDVGGRVAGGTGWHEGPSPGPAGPARRSGGSGRRTTSLADRCPAASSLREAALDRRATLLGWETTTARLAVVLAAAARDEPAMANAADFVTLNHAPGS